MTSFSMSCNRGKYLVHCDHYKISIMYKFQLCAVFQGSDYFSTELARLQRLLEGGKLSPSKLSEISRKVSVLGAFQNDEDTRAEE